MNDSQKHLIYLTGFMGSGKSTIAPILANTLGLQFIDIDREIERMTGKKVAAIFSDSGEEYFRNVEQTLLRDLSRREGCVVSLGGGTLVNESILKLVKSSGLLIYLKTDIDNIVRRMRYKMDRPLLRTTDGHSLTEAELRARVVALLEKREPLYNMADIVVATSNRLGFIIDEIVRALKDLNFGT
jgi:shikimate kinase